MLAMDEDPSSLATVFSCLVYVLAHGEEIRADVGLHHGHTMCYNPVENKGGWKGRLDEDLFIAHMSIYGNNH